MVLELGLTDDLVNTQYAPLAALLATYSAHERLKPLENVSLSLKTREFTPADKLQQLLISILAGCQTLSEVNQKLKPEILLAQVAGWARFADQSSLSRTLDALTLMNITQFQQAITSIWRPTAQSVQHDWRGYLWLDFDLSGLPCSKRAQESQYGYFSGKKKSRAANWRGSAPLSTMKRYGRPSTPAISIRSIACSPPCAAAKVY